MKQRATRIIILFVLLGFVVGIVSGCLSEPARAPEPESDESADMRLVSSFREIPGVAQEDIDAIEAFQQQGLSFTYGMMLSTESFVNPDGEIAGFSALMCQWLESLFGIPFIPTNFIWQEFLDGLESHEIDFTGFLMPSEGREETHFMTSPIAHRTMMYYQVASSLPISAILETRLPRFAFTRDAATLDTVLDRVAYDFEPVLVDEYIDAYRLLRAGEVDAIVSTSIQKAFFMDIDDVEIEYFSPYIYVPVSLSTQNPDLEPFINVINLALMHGADQVFHDLYRQGDAEYTRFLLQRQLTADELAFIRDNPVIPFAAEYDNYPISFYDARIDRWQGIAFDTLRHIEALTGLEFELINEPNTSFYDLLILLEAGNAMIISELYRSPGRQERFIWSDTAFYSAPFAFVSLREHPDINISDIYSERIGVTRGTQYADLLDHLFPDHENILFYSTQIGPFDALLNGEIDLVMTTIVGLLRMTNYLEQPNLKANYVLDDHSFSASLAFNKDAEVLLSIVNKALLMIDTETITGHWLRQTYDYRARLLEERMQAQGPWIIGAFILASVIIIMIFVLFIKSRNAKKHQENLVMQRTTELTNQTSLLKSALEAATAASRAKSDFLSNMSHEMRTPMNAIIGMTAIAKKAESNEQKNHALTKIEDASSHLLGVINDILDMAKIEANKLELVSVEYDFVAMLQKVLSVINFRADEKEQTLSVSIDENIPRYIIGDDQHLAQVITNLLSNAVKFTPQGGNIYFDASLIDEADGFCTLHVEVADNGIGISPEQQKRLFQAFEQAESGISREYGGTGLGLIISKNIISRMGGTIWVESELGKGSKFIFSVKVLRSGKAFSPSDATPSSDDDTDNSGDTFSGKHILLAEDIVINREILVALLEDTGIVIDCAENGKEALDMVAATPDKYDIIFMDMQMPEMDGLEATRRIRAMPDLQGATLPIIAMTANVFKDDVAACFDAGMNDHLGKPLEIEKVMEMLHKYLD